MKVSTKKRTLIITLAIILFSKSSAGQVSTNTVQAKQTIIKMIDEHINALLKSDTTWVSYNFNDKYVYISPLGLISNKADAIKLMISGVVKLDSVKQSEKIAFVYGNCGIVMVLITTKAHAGDLDMSGSTRLSYIFAMINGRWQVVAEQGTSVK